MIELKNIHKTYGGARPLHALDGIDLTIDEGEFVSIMGPSGSGKSTLLNVLGLLDSYDEGEYLLDGELIKNLNRSREAAIRNRNIGFVFQKYNLISFKNALENVELPLVYRGVSQKERHSRAMDILAEVGLDQWWHHLPSQLSGGQQQRVAIARAMITNPKIILADEPTGALDSKTTQEVMNLFRKFNSQNRQTIVLVTHEEFLSKQTSRCIRLRDGQIENDERR